MGGWGPSAPIQHSNTATEHHWGKIIGGMLPFTRAAVRNWLEGLLHIKDSPRRTAAAYALGVFFGFSPFLGLHTVLALCCAFAMRLNRVAVLLGVWSNLPWLIAPYYGFATAVGAMLLGTRLPRQFVANLQTIFDHSPFDGAFWRGTTMLRPLFWPYILGSTIGAVLLAAIAYRAALAFVIARRGRRPGDADETVGA